MTGRQWQKILRRRQESLPSDYAIRGGLLYKYPFNYLLIGILFESSNWNPNRFTVTAFVQPLFIPLGHIAFLFGGRLGSLAGQQEAWWTYSETEEESIFNDISQRIQHEALPLFERLDTPERLLANGLTAPRNASMVYVLETIACSAVIEGAIDRAQTAVQALCREVERHPVEWALVTRDRLLQMVELARHDRSVACSLIDEWRDHTVRCNKLDKPGVLPIIML